MSNSSVFWRGVLVNTIKAISFCIPIYVLNYTDSITATQKDMILLFSIGLVGIGVVLTGIISYYFWHRIGLSPIQMWFKSVLLDLLGTFIFIAITFGLENSIGVFFYFSFFLSWVYFVLIALGIWIGQIIGNRQ
jgi:hypothetical protein